MLSKLKKWWNGDNRNVLPFRVPSGAQMTLDGDTPVILAPTRFANPAARERFCAEVFRHENEREYSMTTIGEVLDKEVEQELAKMRAAVAAKIREAEKAAYEYFCACPVGRERERAHDVYENVRTAMRVG